MRVALADAGALAVTLQARVRACRLSAIARVHPFPPPPPFPGAGDAMDDANFEHGTANGAILRLTKALAWIGRVWRSACRIARGCGWGYTLHAGCAEETLASADGLRDEEPTSFLDRVFQNEMNVAGVVTGQRGGGGRGVARG